VSPGSLPRAAQTRPATTRFRLGSLTTGGAEGAAPFGQCSEARLAPLMRAIVMDRPASPRLSIGQRSCGYHRSALSRTSRLSITGHSDAATNVQAGQRLAQDCTAASWPKDCERLVALVPRPRVHLTRFHGCLAPHYKYRRDIVPVKPPGANANATDAPGEPEP
jgi:hypothetical protein